MEKGLALEKTNKIQEALECYSTNNFEALMKKAEILQTLGKYEESISTLNQASQLNSKDAQL